jgi:hypothetical protein
MDEKSIHELIKLNTELKTELKNIKDIIQDIDRTLGRKFSRSFDIISKTNPIDFRMQAPLDLYPNREYRAAITAFAVYDNISNIKEGINDELKFSSDKVTWKVIKIEQGSWEVSSLSTEINRLIHEEIKELYKDTAPIIFTPSVETVKVNLRLAENWAVDFSHPRSFREILGFDSAVYFKPFQRAPNRAKIDGGRSGMYVCCHNIKGGYLSEKNGIFSDKHILLSIPAFSVTMGSKITIRPINPLYLPLTSKSIDGFQFSIVDEDGKLYDFGGEEIFITIVVEQN